MRDATLLSLRVRPFTMAELLMLRFLSRIADRSAALFRVVARLRFLQHTIGTALGWRAARGMATAEAALLFLLADRPAGTLDELRLKAVLVRTFLASAPPGNAAAMLAAGLQADASRLGLLVHQGIPDGVESAGVH